MERAVPAIIETAASREPAFKSGIFCVAICSSCAFVIFATFVLFGVPDAVSIPTAFLISTGAGGVFVINEKLRSAKTVITTGIISPISPFVR